MPLAQSFYDHFLYFFSILLSKLKSWCSLQLPLISEVFDYWIHVYPLPQVENGHIEVWTDQIEPGDMIFFVENSKSRNLNQVNLVCWLHCPIYAVLARNHVQEVFCTFLSAHISTQIIFVFTFLCQHIWTRWVFACYCGSWQVLCIRRLSSNCQSNFSHVKFIQSIQSSIVYLSVSSRGGPSNLVQSHVDKKKSVRPILWTRQFTNRTISCKSHERRRY